MKKLNLFAPINNLGYGIVGFNLLKALSQKLDVSLSLIGTVSTSEPSSEFIQDSIRKLYQFDGFHNAPCLKVWHEFSLAERVGSGPCFAFPFFEINKLDQRRINHLSSVDGIIVASQWAKDIITKSQKISVPVSVIPLGVDTSIFTHGPHPATDKCVFLNCGKWEKRKGHDLLLKMFQTAFPNETDVELQMMPSNPFLPDKNKYEWERYYKSDSRVKILDRVATHAEVANIMSSTNCGIFPSRAEGWNLEILEMMSMGKSIITTNYSAHTQFCNHQNSRLINIERFEKAEDGLFFDGSSGEWASLEGAPFEQGVTHLKEFYRQWQSNHAIINEEGIQTAKKLSWTNTANQIEETIYGNQSAEIN